MCHHKCDNWFWNEGGWEIAVSQSELGTLMKHTSYEIISNWMQ